MYCEFFREREKAQTCVYENFEKRFVCILLGIVCVRASYAESVCVRSTLYVLNAGICRVREDDGYTRTQVRPWTINGGRGVRVENRLY